jgi:hypothetical protein
MAPIYPIDLGALAISLSQAFGDAIHVEVHGPELVLKIGAKTAWINARGELTGEACSGTQPVPQIPGLLWITNHPRSLKGLWPRRAGVQYIEGSPHATEWRTSEQLTAEGLIGVYVQGMTREEYRSHPLAHTPQDLADMEEPVKQGIQGA